MSNASAMQDDGLAFELRQRMTGWLSDGSLHLPGLPAIVAEAMRLANDSRASVAEIEELVTKDQAIAGRIIQTANSPLLRGVEDITSLSRAITQLGRDELRLLLFGSFVQTHLFRSRRYGRLMGQIWRHSLAVGAVSARLARLLGEDAESAFLAGFLHDAGKAALLATLTEKIGEQSDYTEAIAERAMQPLHDRVSETLARSWRMPEAVVEAVAHHHRPLHAPEHMHMAAVVEIADALCYRFGIGFEQEQMAAYERPQGDYLPLKENFQRIRTLGDVTRLPAFELFEKTPEEILAAIEQALGLIERELQSPFVRRTQRGVMSAKKPQPSEPPPEVKKPQSRLALAVALAALAVAGGVVAWLVLGNV